MDDHILKMTPRKPPGRPWETFPAFAAWSDAMTPKDDPDGLRGVRAGCALAGTIGLLSRAVLASFDTTNVHQETVDTVQGESARALMAASILADEIGFNPMRTLGRPIDDYVIRFNIAYGIHEAIPYEERPYIMMNLFMRVCQHMLPVAYAVSIDRFTLDGLRRDEACEELLKGVHELQTLLHAYDIPLSACLERHVMAVREDARLNPEPGVPIDDEF